MNTKQATDLAVNLYGYLKLGNSLKMNKIIGPIQDTSYMDYT